MSRYSGKCDLYDHLMMENRKNSDSIESEFECFEIFKKRTGGVLYQSFKMELTDFNAEREISRNPEKLSRTLHEEEVSDKRSKNGKRIKKYYTYTFYGKEYSSLKELNKNGYWTTLELHFDSILDLIPFYPHIIALCASDQEGERIYISNIPYPLECDQRLTASGITPFGNYYRKELQDHYLEVVKYLLKKEEGNNE